MTICLRFVFSKCVIKRTVKGYTVLDLCEDEGVLLDIINRFDINEIELGSNDKNLLHHIAKRDQFRVMQHLLKLLLNNQVADLLTQQSSNTENNVLMRAAIHNSKKCLQLLLQHVGPWLRLKKYKSYLDKIMHSVNADGNNLLGIVLQQK